MPPRSFRLSSITLDRFEIGAVPSLGKMEEDILG